MSPDTQAVGAGSDVTGPPAYDIGSPLALPAEQIAVVGTIHRKFSQSLAHRLGDRLGTPVTAQLAGVEQMPFADFLGACADAACLIPLRAMTVGQAILEFSPGFLHRVVALLIGAPEGAAGPPRGITGIERHIVRECVDDLIVAMREVWASYRVNFEPVSIAQADEEMQPPTGNAVVSTVLVDFGGSQESVRFAAPALLVRLAVMGTDVPPAPVPEGTQPLLLEALRTAAVQVEAVLSGPNLQMRDLLTLAPGQVLIFGPPASCPVECVVNGVSKFRGELVSSGRNQALQIESPIETRPRRID